MQQMLLHYRSPLPASFVSPGTIYNILKDNAGWIWLATEEGCDIPERQYFQVTNGGGINAIGHSVNHLDTYLFDASKPIDAAGPAINVKYTF